MDQSLYNIIKRLQSDKSILVQSEILVLLEKILIAVEKEEIVLRLFGGLAIIIRCHNHSDLLAQHNRKPLDLDFVAYLKDIVKIQRIFLDLGFEENQSIMRLFGRSRRIFYFPNNKAHVDIVLDYLHFCHKIDLRGRLEKDFLTIPLADLLLSKLQIVQLNEKDVLDTIILLLEYELGQNGSELIDVDYIACICSNNWGLWKTITMNLEQVKSKSGKYLSDKKLKLSLISKIERITKSINTKEKTIQWKLRGLLGSRIKWYNDVEEFTHNNEAGLT